VRTWSIRTHILLLILAVSVPLLAIVGFGIYSDIQQSINRTKTSLRILVETMVSHTDKRNDQARQVLEGLAARPLVRRVDPRNCDGILKDLLLLNPGYANVAYTNLDGLVVCSAVPQPGGKMINIGKSQWFQKFLKEKRFVIGQPFYGPISHKWVSVLSAPIWNERHEMVGSIQLPHNLELFDPNIPDHLLPADSRYGFFSEDGTLVWRNVDPQHAIGTRPDTDAARKIVKMLNTEFEAVAADGVKRFYIVKHMPDIGWVAWVGVPATSIYANAKRRAVIAIAFSLAAIVLMLIFAILIAKRITRPMAALEKAAGIIHDGDLGVRAEVEGPSEIIAVTKKFNAMVNAQQSSVTQLRIAAAAFESQESMMVTDANSVILRVNKAFTETTGYTAEEVVGRTPQLLYSDRHDADFYRSMWETINRTGGWRGEMWDRRKNGEVYPKWLTITAVKGDDGAVTNYIGTHTDITERKQAEENINKLAFFDQLTGLPNRTLLLDRLNRTSASSTRSGKYGALILIDLDNFKTLNDTLGHDMGDLLLQLVSQRLTECVRDEDTVARLGGDEFVVMLVNLNQVDEVAANEAKAVCEKILLSLNQTYHLKQNVCHSTPSIGATLFKGQDISIDDLLKQADLAMYESKEAGRNTINFFDPVMQAIVIARAALEAGLRTAITHKQFLLYYQPQIAGEGRIIGAEALIRWQHPQRGMVSPAEFIPLAEATGLILQVGQWVLETACTQLAEWASQPGFTNLTLSVNVSAHQFRQPDFINQVLEVLNKTGANPQRLKLELTESLLVKNVDDIIEKMFALKAKGVGFSLDDFGTGYSSLSYLKRMPLDQLKIDQSFVRDVLIDPNDAAIARTVVALAQNLGLGVIAEGVETEEQLKFLASIGCHTYQGYFFSRPQPIDEFQNFVRKF